MVGGYYTYIDSSTAPEGKVHAFVWDDTQQSGVDLNPLLHADSVTVPGQPLPADSSMVTCMNGYGMVAGVFWTAGNYQAYGFVRQMDGTLTVFSAPTPTSSIQYVTAINNQGQIIGRYQYDAQQGQFGDGGGFFFDSSLATGSKDVAVGLGNTGAADGYFYVWPQALNDAGKVVGTVFSTLLDDGPQAYSSEAMAFTWTAGAMTALPLPSSPPYDPSARSSLALAINSAGQVAGLYYDSYGQGYVGHGDFLDAVDGTTSLRLDDYVGQAPVGPVWESVTHSADAISPFAVSEDGTVTGTALGADGKLYLVRWLSGSGTAQNLGSVSMYTGDITFRFQSLNYGKNPTGVSVNENGERQGWLGRTNTLYQVALDAPDAATYSGFGEQARINDAGIVACQATIGSQGVIVLLESLVDSDVNGLPDAWEYGYFGQPVANPGASLWPGSTLTAFDAYQQGLNPNAAAPGGGGTGGGSTGGGSPQLPATRPADFPVTNYAVIDVSGSIPVATNCFGKGSFDDSNRVSFISQSTSGFDTYTWQNGTLSAPNFVPYAGGDAVNGTQDGVYRTPAGVLSNGTPYGVSYYYHLFHYYPEHPDDPKDTPYDYYRPIYQAYFRSVSVEFVAPSSYGYGDSYAAYIWTPQGYQAQGMGPNVFPLVSASTNGTFSALALDVIVGDPKTSPPRQNVTYITAPGGGPTVLDDTAWWPVDPLTGFHVDDFDFDPSLVNNNGWAGGKGKIWNGSAYVPLVHNTDICVDLNDQNLALVNEFSNSNYLNGYLWTGSGPRVLLKDKMVDRIQPAIGDMVGSHLSNADASGTIHLTGKATYGGHEHDLVATKTSAGTWDFRRMQLPAGVTAQGVYAINNSGVMAAIGSSGAVAGHVLLIVPIEYNDFFVAPAVAQFGPDPDGRQVEEFYCEVSPHGKIKVAMPALASSSLLEARVQQYAYGSYTTYFDNHVPHIDPKNGLDRTDKDPEGIISYDQIVDESTGVVSMDCHDVPGRDWSPTIMSHVTGIDVNVHYFDYLQCRWNNGPWCTVGTLEWYFVGYYDNTTSPGTSIGGVGGSRGYPSN